MILIIVGVISILSLVLALLNRFSLKKDLANQQYKIDEMQAEIGEVKKANLKLITQLKEIHSANYIFCEQLNQLSKDIEQAEARQLELQTNDPDNKLYSRAVKMVELGADIEEIIKECEIPRAEAELLINLHKK